MAQDHQGQAAPLSGVRVIEFSDYESLQSCGRTLASLGADVVKLEGPAGDPLRDGPGAPAADGTRSFGFEFLNSGKRSVQADLTTEEGRASARALVSSADVVLVSPEHAEQLDLDAVPRPPDQLRVIAGAFGGRPVDGAPTTALTRLHAASTGYLVPADKDMSIRPGWGGQYSFEAMFGTCIAVAVLAEMRRDGGGEIDFSFQGYGVWMDKMIFPRVSLSDSFDIHRNTNAYPFGGNMRCADGYVCVFVIEEHQWRNLARLLGQEQWLEDARFANGVRRMAVQDEIDEVLAAWCAERTVSDCVGAGRAADIPVAPVRAPGDVLNWEQLASRGFFEIGDTAYGSVKIAGLPFGPGLPSVKLGPAPRLGEARAEQAWSARAEERSRTDRRGDGRLPLEGLRVLDFTWAAAGPIATSIMAFLGADIAKVEHRSRPDLMRVAQKQYGYAEDDDLDASPAFQELAAGKRSIELDLKNPEDRALAFEMASVADVLIENMRPGKIEEMGLSYEAVSAVNPRIVMCSQSATGRCEGTGIPGYAPIFWAEGGGAWLTGWPDARPGVVRGPVDFHAAAFACLGTLAMLEQRARTGVGGYVDCSAIETVSLCFGPELLEAAVTGVDVTRRGNALPGYLVNDVFPCYGYDEWIALSIRGEEEWAVVVGELGIDGVDQGASAAERYAAIAEATVRWDPSRLEARLTRRGIPAARSLSLRAAIGDAAPREPGDLATGPAPQDR